jgi:monoamine oxidase
MSGRMVNDYPGILPLVKVAIVGCGLAGLRSAMLLEAAGHEVLLFEGRDRPGGRLHTAPSGFEIGAEWIDEEQERMRGLLKNLGIAEIAAPEGEYLYLRGGSRCLESMVSSEANADVDRFESLAEAARPGYDSVKELIDAACLCDEGKWIVTTNVRSDEGDEPQHIGLEPWLDYRELYKGRDGGEASAYRIDGGGSRLVGAMLSRLRTAPRFGSILQRVRLDGSVHLGFHGFTESVDAVILALPLPCLLGLDIDPPLPNLAELKKLSFAPMVKARYRFDSAFWRHEGWYGYLKTNCLVQQTWPDRMDSSALVSYICGDAARRLALMENPESCLKSEWAQVTSHLAPEVEVKVWANDPFTRGGFTIAPPGSDPKRARQRAAGPIQIAGEFAAEWMGFMEGALESAESAVATLTKKPARG